MVVHSGGSCSLDSGRPQLMMGFSPWHVSCRLCTPLVGVVCFRDGAQKTYAIREGTVLK